MAIVAGPSGRRAGATDQVARYFPVVAFVMVLVLVVAFLPTALRPPQQPPNTSAQFSPDAPPDDQQDSIVGNLGLGQSGTVGDKPAGEAAGPPVTQAPPPPSFCPNGFGDPRRQVESVYSAPCAGAWQGDNGGATSKGVTGSEIRIGFANLKDSSSSMAINDGEDPVIHDEPQDGESDGYRTWRVYQQYFNQNFQLWGRRIRFVVRNPSSSLTTSTASLMTATVQELDEQYHVFGVQSNYDSGLLEAARRHLVGLGGWQLPGSLYDDHQPYLVSWKIDGSKLARFNAEYICKQLAKRPAAYAGDGVMGKPRKFGMIAAAGYGQNGLLDLKPLLKQQCGVALLVQEFSDDDEQAVATAIAQMRTQGVTTIAAATDPLTISAFLKQADSQAYFPEWFITGTMATDWSVHASLFGYSPTQWQHAFGLSPMPMGQLDAETDAYRAYKSIDPANTPAGSDGNQLFYELLQIVNGLQMAGPNLTPETFREGLNKMGGRQNEPAWTIGGGFGLGDPTYADDVAEMWWDRNATNVLFNNVPGAYRYTGCGRRFRLGEIPVDPSPLFDPNGTCIAAPHI